MKETRIEEDVLSTCCRLLFFSCLCFMIIFEMVFVCYIGCQMSVETSQDNEFNLIGFLGLKEKKSLSRFSQEGLVVLKNIPIHGFIS